MVDFGYFVFSFYSGIDLFVARNTKTTDAIIHDVTKCNVIYTSHSQKPILARTYRHNLNKECKNGHQVTKILLLDHMAFYIVFNNI